MPTQRYEELITNIDNIEKNILPAIRLDGAYDLRDDLLVRGYRLLVHAEIECYFEDIGKQIARKARANWTTNGQIDIVLGSMMTFCLGQWKLLDEIKPGLQDPLTERVIEAHNYYEKKLLQNNGLKQKHLLEILLPIGIQLKDLDLTWLTDMDQFGEARGATAHNSIKVKIPGDPKVEKTRIDKIMLEIARLDEIFLNKI